MRVSRRTCVGITLCLTHGNGLLFTQIACALIPFEGTG